MKFSTVKTISMSVLLAGLAIAAVGYFTLGEGSPEYVFTEVMSCVCLAAAVLIVCIWSRCPKCGHRIIFQAFKYTKCPKCGSPLIEKASKAKNSGVKK